MPVFIKTLVASLRRRVKPNTWCLQIFSLLNIHRQPDKLGHGPRQWRRRAGSGAAPLPHLLWNHQAFVRKTCHCVQPFARTDQVTSRDLILTTFASQQGPETPDTIASIVITAVRSLTVRIVIVAIPRITERRFNFYQLVYKFE